MTTATGPIVSRKLWLQVIERAGRRCECEGRCGRKHMRHGGRCPREDSRRQPLHAVPEEAARPVQQMCMKADQCIALCDDCHGGVLAARRKAARQGGTEALRDMEPLW